MIEITGNEGTSEHRAASAIAAALEAYWPGISRTPAEDELVRISSNTKLSNYKVSDIDVVLAAKLGPSRYVIPKMPLKDGEGRAVIGAKIRVRSLVAAIEVKDQGADGLRITAGNVDARYKEGWKSATAQNDAQKYALLNYFRDYTREEPWIYRCLLLQGIDELPKERGRHLPVAATVAAGFDAPTLVAAMVAENTLRKIGGEYVVSSGERDLVEMVLGSRLFEQVIPSTLDLKKMNRIAARPAEAQELAALLGDKRVHLRGEGGTGKTVLLAQAAHEAFKAHGKRCLILTYHHALTADIQRLLALMGIPSSSDAGGVDVRTVMSFTYAWLSRLGLLGSREDQDFEHYRAKCAEALGYLERGAIGQDDIERALREDPEQFDYDAILVDEAQDWPQEEASLLAGLYGGTKVSLADGVSQLVRGTTTDWKATLPAGGSKDMTSLRECLRMKANLGVFANAVAHRADLNWEILPSTKAAGGRVILTFEPFEKSTGLHRDLLRAASEQGCEPVDFLYCVPPSGVQVKGNARASTLARSFELAGMQSWDGVDPIARRDYPRSPAEHRVVQYDSCRGLEGWVTVLDGFDEFWANKYQEALAFHSGSAGMASEEQLAARTAWRWALMALTRPIDTLVITLRDRDSIASRTLLGVAGSLPDIVEVH